MNILLTMNLPYSRWSGGANRANRFMLEALAARGHATTAVVPLLPAPPRQSEQEVLDALAAEGVAARVTDASVTYTMAGVQVHAVRRRETLREQLRAKIEACEPDVVLVSSEDQSQQLLDVAVRTRPSRTVYLALTPQMLPFGPESLHPGTARTGTIASARAIASLSEAMAAYVRTHLGRDSFVMRLPWFGTGPFPRLASFRSGRVLLLNPCRVKGIDIFLDLARAVPTSSFLAVPGYGTTTEDLRRLAEVPNVSVQPNARNLDELLRDVSVLVMPSLWMEGLGLAAIDAMLRGIPVLAAEHGGLIEAKLGTPGLLPVTPITQYHELFDEALLPMAVVPPQPVGPWRDALGRLLADEAHHDAQSALSRAAAIAYVDASTVAPFESWLSSLGTHAPAAGPHVMRAGVSAPGNASIEDRVRNLSPIKQAILLHQLVEHARVAPARPRTDAPHGGPGSSGAEGLPLSPAQEGVWLAQQRAPANVAYNMSLILRATGALSIDALRQAIQDVVRRRAILRTTYRVTRGMPRQYVQAEAEVPFETYPLPGGLEAMARGITQLEQRAATPFRLDRELPIRVTAIQLSPLDHLIGFVLHHICCDGRSVAILARELGEAYAIATGAAADARAPQPFQYAEYVSWQRARAGEPELQRQLEYWRRRLRGFAPLRLGHATSGGGAATFRAGFHRVALSPAVTESLRRASQARGVSLFTLVLAGVALLLQAWTRRDDLAIAIDVANRTRGDWDDVIGLMTNQVLVRLDLEPGLAVNDPIACAARELRDALDHQEAPWERVAETLPGRQGGSGAPPYQVKLVYSADPVAIALPGLDVREVSRPRVMTKCDLTLFVEDGADTLAAEVEYNADAIDAAVVQQHLAALPAFWERIAIEANRGIDSATACAAVPRS